MHSFRLQFKAVKRRRQKGRKEAGTCLTDYQEEVCTTLIISDFGVGF
ncbi:MAG: hypothetical protein GX416_13930 [Bacteroidales bacterium]|nr:hypothetical protein [Bacteroidales bacterium]